MVRFPKRSFARYDINWGKRNKKNPLMTTITAAWHMCTGVTVPNLDAGLCIW